MLTVLLCHPSRMDLCSLINISLALRASVKLITNTLERSLLPRGWAVKTNTRKPHFCHRDMNSPVSASKAWPLREGQTQLRRGWQFCMGMLKGMMSEQPWGSEEQQGSTQRMP